MPAVGTFGPTTPLPPQRSNTEMARDFLDLSFALESGRSLPAFTRFEGPMSVTLTGHTSDILSAELRSLILRLKHEARLDLYRATDPTKASITVEGITTADLQRVVPQAACFVLPTRVTWAEFRRDQRRVDYDWSRQAERTAISVFIPVDTSRQEIRDCLHEEIAQGLGPLNDLFRLEDSVFNDDNMHSILTGFDMLMLRATYHPSLKSGMSRAQVAAILPGVLSALNPRGNSIPTRAYRPSSQAWVMDITRAIGPGSDVSRRTAAHRAQRLASAEGWNDVRTALSFYTVGRLTIARDSDAALESFLAAGDIYKRRTSTQIHAAAVGFHVAAIALRAGQWDAVLSLTDRYAPIARKAENAALLADLLFARSAALQALNRPYMATKTEALSWGLFAFGTENRTRQRAAEIAALATRAQA